MLKFTDVFTIMAIAKRLKDLKDLINGDLCCVCAVQGHELVGGRDSFWASANPDSQY